MLFSLMIHNDLFVSADVTVMWYEDYMQKGIDTWSFSFQV